MPGSGAVGRRRRVATDLLARPHRRLARRRARQPGSRVRGHPAQHRLRRRRRARRDAGASNAPASAFAAQLREGRAGAGGPRVALLEPQTFMNDAGRSVGPARGAARAARARARHPRRDRPAVRRGAQPRSAAVSPATTGCGRCGASSAAPTSGAFAPASADPSRPTRRSSPATCSDRFREPREEVDALVARAADAAVAIVAERVSDARAAARSPRGERRGHRARPRRR